MNKSELRTLKAKAKALDLILNVYSPKFQYDEVKYEGDLSYAQQRDNEVDRILNNLKNELLMIKNLLG